MRASGITPRGIGIVHAPSSYSFSFPEPNSAQRRSPKTLFRTRSTRTPSPARLLHVFAIWRVLVNSAQCMGSGGEGDRVCTELEGSGIVLLFVSYCVTRMPFSRGGAWHSPISRPTPANVQLNPLALKTLKSHTSIISVQKDVDYTVESPHYCRPQLGFRGGPNSRQVAVPPSWTTFPSSPFLIFM